jgi:hypothetical protein
MRWLARQWAVAWQVGLMGRLRDRTGRSMREEETHAAEEAEEETHARKNRRREKGVTFTLK